MQTCLFGGLKEQLNFNIENYDASFGFCDLFFVEGSAGIWNLCLCRGQGQFYLQVYAGQRQQADGQGP